MVKEWVFVPMRGLGPISLGMKKAEVNEVLGPRFFCKSNVAWLVGIKTDLYSNRRIEITYWEDETVAQVGIMRPFIATVFDINVFSQNPTELETIFSGKGIPLKREGNKLRFIQHNAFLLLSSTKKEYISSFVVSDVGFEEMEDKRSREYLFDRPSVTINDLLKKY